MNGWMVDGHGVRVDETTRLLCLQRARMRARQRRREERKRETRSKNQLEIDIELVPDFPLLKPLVNRPLTTHTFSKRLVRMCACECVCLQLKMWNWIAKTVIKAEAAFCN